AAIRQALRTGACAIRQRRAQRRLPQDDRADRRLCAVDHVFLPVLQRRRAAVAQGVQVQPVQDASVAVLRRRCRRATLTASPTPRSAPLATANPAISESRPNANVASHSGSLKYRATLARRGQRAMM